MKTNSCRSLSVGAALVGLLGAGMGPVTAQSVVAPNVAPLTAARPYVRPYVLSPDDQLSISVLGHPDLTSAVTVLPDGTFRYPIVGTVHAAGMTVDGLTRSLTTGLSDQLNAPQVTVSIVQSRPRKVSILGSVKMPGQYDVRPGTHLLDVIAACGGFAQSAQLTQATLVVDNGQKSLPVDVPGLMDGSVPDQNIPLEAGDVLLVQARDPAAGQVQVIGEVLKPGAIDIPADGLSVEALLAETGGATPTAAMTQAQILHGGRTTLVNLRPLLSDLTAPVGQTRLMPGDVLLVPANQAKIAILGDVRTPGQYLIPDGRALSLTEALSLTGGPAPDADTKKASIVRRDAVTGTATVLPINLDALLKGDPKTADVYLQSGDVLYLPTRGSHQSSLQALGALGFLAPFVHL